ncbi:TIR domain-containing protein [Pectobacterium quasiaquaticum]|uniref:TIR domain-containing protein n=1 Tax=Pectobacterium quasiaquaticum TaxID=2774015 RepID=UPI001CF7E6A6|nr:TIR domain-containing protein [Pectobacterium quasiaquaticum]
MDSDKAIEILQKQKNIISSFENRYADIAFEKWQRDTRIAIHNIFTNKPEYSLEFGQIGYGYGIYSSRRTELERITRFNEGLQKAVFLIDSFIDEINNYGLTKVEIENNLPSGKNVFIGHGRSSLWRELKDFIKDKLQLPYDEFNRVPVAGLSNALRLQQMLDQSCIAFLIMTAEDELQDGNKQARMNVVHEVGLFQGRLGFEKAIVLLEEGCEEFSNINGLGQIRFPAGNISAIFEHIRDVLERESVIR